MLPHEIATAVLAGVVALPPTVHVGARIVAAIRRPRTAVAPDQGTVLHTEDEGGRETPLSAAAFLRRAEVLMAGERPNEAEADYRRARALDPHAAGPLCGLATLAMLGGRTPAAVAYLAEAWNHDPETVRAALAGPPLEGLRAHPRICALLGDTSEGARAA